MTTPELECPYDHVRLTEAGCWEWLGYVDSNGYGHHRGKFAHRVYFEMFNDTEIPAGLHLDHLCRNRSCVNPEHLEPVSPKENILRGVGAGAQNARKTHCIKGHEFTPENTRIMKAPNGQTRQCRECNRATQRENYAKYKANGKFPPSKMPEVRKQQYLAQKSDRQAVSA
ncbi:HNH endonuclease signature motif containing protein [Microbacterium sp. W4I20]|uniref:HNH endonuclease signature motif containing protein n=1 Tax=Microbacterium sp. W4I20 TaxID=3042262 RepID=UPI00277DE03B|nr:HNH endonuclease signature motif containing protein [Microbacterium sp. W4I20]MDQ0726849.1 hypothetical protein [Microbacterium sp. W4I20]